MKLSVLGPMDVRIGNVPITPRAAKLRQVLAVLAINAGELVPPARLIDELWETPPRSARTTLQTYVLRIRRMIDGAGGAAPGGKSLLMTRHGGYLLDTDHVDVDIVRFARLEAEGTAALRAGSPAVAARKLRAALALWRADAFTGVTQGPEISLHAGLLCDRRAQIVESRVEADLAAGRHRELLPELAELTRRSPLREELCAHYMVALTRAGQPGRALRAYGRLHRDLVDRLGIEPSAWLQELNVSVHAATAA